MTRLAIYFGLGMLGSALLTPVCRLVANRLGLIAKPQEDRWHRQPTALFGGVGIVITTLIAGVTTHPSPELWQLLGAGLLIAGFGLADDVLSLKASTKLIVEITIASMLIFFGYALDWTDSMVFDAMLTLFWIVGITNAFNLLDNMDGLCAGTALVAGAFLVIGLVTEAGPTAPATYLAAMLGATAGFLVYNFHPASIFMGDTGSLFLGLNVAAITLLANPESAGRSGPLSVVIAPVILLLVPILDTTLVTAMRLLSGRRPSQGGRDHTSHRLVTLGLSEPRAVVTLWLLAAAGGTISVLVQRQSQGLAGVLAVTFLLAMIIFGVYLARIRVYDETNLTGLRRETLTPLVANFMYKRRVVEVLLDLCLIPIAYYTAYRLRFEGNELGANYPLFIQSLPVVIAIQLLSLFLVGGYRGTWRFFGMMDAVVFAKGILLGTAGTQLTILYVYRFQSYSRAVFVIYAALLMLLLAGSRASFRLVSEFILRRLAVGRRCIIYGMNGMSLATIREAFGPNVVLKIIGFIDDDPLHHRTRVGGYSVLGDGASLPAIIARGEVDCVVVNTPLADEKLRVLDLLCREHDVELVTPQLNLRRFNAAS
jgi:UDP-GlcNAc:undecaprenyl-phosphate GlcNAc-1-phosphate transferase